MMVRLILKRTVVDRYPPDIQDAWEIVEIQNEEVEQLLSETGGSGEDGYDTGWKVVGATLEEGTKARNELGGGDGE